MKKLIFCLSILISQVAMAQKIFTYKGEYAVTDLKLIEDLMPLLPGLGSPMKDLMNEQSIKAYMMTPRKVGDRPQYTSYSVASCMEFYLNFKKNYKENLSPDYIYLSVESDGKPHKVEDALQFVANSGTVSAAILPYDASTIGSNIYATQKFKIKNYLVLFREVTTAKQKLFEVKKALMRGNPVLVEMAVNQEFKSLNNTKYWSPATLKSTQNQALIAVGYDEDRKAIELQNCMGTDWGNNGYVWISYDDFGKMAQNGFVLVVE
jgi:hypothetical protein